MKPRRSRQATQRQVNSATVGSDGQMEGDSSRDRWSENRCLGRQWATWTEQVCCDKDFVTFQTSHQWRHLDIGETSRCSLWDRRLRRTEPSLDPLWLSLSETWRQLRPDFGGIFRGQLACGVAEMRSECDPETLYSLFNCPSRWRLLSDYFV